ncbi:MAG: type II CAAX endopeptidase family protein, partial [Acidaminobacteraceae bacterium]
VNVQRNFDLVKSTWLYLMLAVLFIFLGSYVQGRDCYSGIFITEYIIVFLPVILLGLATKVDMKKALRLNKIKFSTIWKTFLLSFALLPIIAASNLLVITVLSYFGKVIIPDIPMAKNVAEFLVMFFLVAISPGICEEVLFRGLIMNAFESHFNRKIGVVAAAVLFGIFHFNIQNILGPVILGLVFGYLVQVTNSIVTSILLHTFNNGIAVVASYLASKSTLATEASKLSTQDLYNTPSVLVAQTIIFVLLASASAILALAIIKSIVKDYRKVEINDKIIIASNTFVVIDKTNELAILSKESELGSKDRTLKSLKLDDKKVKSLKRTLTVWTDKVKNPFEIKYFIPIGISVIMYFVILILQLTKN